MFISIFSSPLNLNTIPLSMAVRFYSGNNQATFTIKIRHPPMPKLYTPGPKKGKTDILNNYKSFSTTFI